VTCTNGFPLATFSVITRFETDKMYQVFIQGGTTIEAPAPAWEGIPGDINTINPEFCEAAPVVFGDRDRFGEVGGYPQLNRALALPMVLVMSIWSDVRGHSHFQLTTHERCLLMIRFPALRKHALA
jgi:hypothetical protein